jgi:hypothetical protein
MISCFFINGKKLRIYFELVIVVKPYSGYYYFCPSNATVEYILLIIFNDELELQDPQEYEPKGHKANRIE